MAKTIRPFMKIKTPFIAILLGFVFCISQGFQTSSGTITKDELLGKFDPAKQIDFIKIEKQYSSKEGIYLREQAYDAFKKMFVAASKENVPLVIISATRNFDYQKSIWEKKWLQENYKGWNDLQKVNDIMKFSSMPGTSRHHWGTDIDLNSVTPSYFDSGKGKVIYDWLVKHGSEYGFYQTYTNKSGGRTGYSEEKWHWSYLPLASLYLKQYNEMISYSDLKGFSGSSSAKAAKSIELYVNGIDSSLKQ
jgi:zinc D-Ala-D-Ala carboxypeptidase